MMDFIAEGFGCFRFRRLCFAGEGIGNFGGIFGIYLCYFSIIINNLIIVFIIEVVWTGGIGEILVPRFLGGFANL